MFFSLATAILSLAVSAVLSLAESGVPCGHPMGSSTIRTTLFLPFEPFIDCDYFPTKHPFLFYPLFSISSSSDSFLESSLEKLKYHWSRGMGSVSSLTRWSPGPLSKVLFGVDVSFVDRKFLMCISLKLFNGSMKNIGSVFCECLKEDGNVHNECRGITWLSHTMACSASSSCSLPYTSPYISPINKDHVLLPMFSLLPTPSTVWKLVIEAEMGTYYLLWQSIAILSYNAEAISCGRPAPRAETIEGWELVFTAKLGEVKPSPQREDVPFATLAKRDYWNRRCLGDRCLPSCTEDYLVTFREAQNEAEWGINFSYNQMLDDYRSLNSTGIHRGFVGLASSVFALFDPFLREANDEERLGLITVTGHGFGAGVGAAFSFLLSRFYPKTFVGENRIRAVLFAPPKSGKTKLMTELADNVVMRNIIAEFDPVSAVPCRENALCSSAPAPTSKNLHTREQYDEYPGLIEVLREDLTPFFSTNYTNLKVGRWHFCSYECWTSRNAYPGHLSGCAADANSSNPNAQCRYS